MIRMSSLFAAAACAVPLEPSAAVDAGHRGLGNWADHDTSGLGTHRVMVDALNVRDAAGGIIDVADRDQQLVLTGAATTVSGTRFLEAVFKGGALDAGVGWVAGQYLAHTELEVCAPLASIRAGDALERVLGQAELGDAAFVVSGTIRNTGQHRYFEVSVAGLRGFVATGDLCARDAAGPAARVLASHAGGALTLWNENFGRADGASPLENVADAAAGLPARRSCGGGAPCGTVHLDDRMLDALAGLHPEFGYQVFVTSIAGAAHSSGSLHYAGRAFDIDEIDGQRVTGDTALTRAYMEACWALGAVEVFGPSNDPYGHADHIHCGF